MCGYPYILCFEMEVAITRDWFLVVSKRYLDYILAEPEEGCRRH